MSESPVEPGGASETPAPPDDAGGQEPSPTPDPAIVTPPAGATSEPHDPAPDEDEDDEEIAAPEAVAHSLVESKRGAVSQDILNPAFAAPPR